MNSRERRDGADDDFDQIVRAALRETTRGQAPSARAREALLRAAEADRRSSIQISSLLPGPDRVGAKQSAKSNTSEQWDQTDLVSVPLIVWVFEAQFIKLRAIL